MSYWLESDAFADDEVWVALAEKGGGRYGGPLYDTLKASYCDLMAKASHGRKNGYLTASTALRYCRNKKRVLELLCLSVLGEPPRLHRPTDDCACLGGEWIDGYEYRIHAFLKRNPSKSERERNDAMKADRRNDRLRALVYERDGGCCRYCRSGPLPTNMGRARDRRKVRSYDHVDPDQPAGPSGEGYVVACDRCNAEKGHRLPKEADMVLLGEPTEAERHEWLARDLAVFDRAPTAPRPRPDRDQGAVDDRDRGAVTEAITDDDPGAELRPELADGQPRPLPARSGNPSGSGRVADGRGPGPGPPVAASLDAQPPRGSTDPDIYHRRSRASPDPGPPEYRWPPGSYQVGPRRRHQDQHAAEQDPNSSEGLRPPWT